MTHQLGGGANAFGAAVVTKRYPAARKLLWEAKSLDATEASSRFYATLDGPELTYNARWSGSSWVSDITAKGASKFVLQETKMLCRTVPSGYTTWSDTAWVGAITQLDRLGGNFYKTYDPPNTTYAPGTTVVASYTPAAGYNSIVGAYVVLPGNLGPTPLFSGIRLTYSDASTRTTENGNDPVVTITRGTSSWTQNYAADGLAVTKVEFYVRNTGSSYTFNVGAFTFDGEQY